MTNSERYHYYKGNYQKYYRTHREQYRLWQQNNRSKMLVIMQNYHRRKRDAVIDLLGASCVRCGFSDNRALQIDHIDGGGTRDIKRFNGWQSYYKYILDNAEKAKKEFQVLCSNCNWIKRVENQEALKRWQ